MRRILLLIITSCTLFVSEAQVVKKSFKSRQELSEIRQSSRMTEDKGTTFTFTDASNQNIDGIKLSLARGSGSISPAYYSNGLRLYEGNTITISGKNIQRIELTFTRQGKKDYAALTSDKDGLVSGGNSQSAKEEKVDVWTGSVGSVTFTLGKGQRLFKKAVVFGEGGEGEVEGDNDDGDVIPQGLDENYDYGEPATIRPSKDEGSNMAYSFIEDNIYVNCTKGARTAGYFSCNAAEEITFAATKPFNSIVINGFVKQGFDVKVNHGTVEMANASEGEVTANPVVVVNDINAKSVTLQCEKQMRCYSVDFYFSENPDVTPGDENNDSDTEIDMSLFNKMDGVAYFDEDGTLSEYGFYFSSDEVDYYLSLDFYAKSEETPAGKYSTKDNDFNLEYSAIVIGDNDYIEISGCELALADNNDGTYQVDCSITDDKGNQYTFSYTASCFIYNGEYPYEPMSKQQDTNLEFTYHHISAENIEDTYTVYLMLYNDETQQQLSLCYLTDDVDFVNLPDGTYEINDSEEFGTFYEGYYGYFGYDGCLAMTGDYLYYLVSGIITVNTQDGITTITLDATSYYGTKITATYSYSSYASGLLQTTSDKQTCKVIRNGNMYIFRNGRMYNLQGVITE